MASAREMPWVIRFAMPMPSRTPPAICSPGYSVSSRRMSSWIPSVVRSYSGMAWL